MEGVAFALVPLVVGGIKAGQRAIRSLGVPTQGAGIPRPERERGTASGSPLWCSSLVVWQCPRDIPNGAHRKSGV
jgi:hypothetical protein